MSKIDFIERIFSRVALLFTSLLLTLTFGVCMASADTHTWDGGGGDNNWSTCANWNTVDCPAGTDTVVFDTASSDKDSTIDSGWGGTITVFNINTYGGTITLARSLTISTTFAQSGGTFNGADQSINILGTASFTLSGGTFTSTSGTLSIAGSWTHTAGGTFNHNSGTVLYTGNNKTFNFESTIVGGNSGQFWNFTFNTTAANPLTISAGDSLVANNTLLLTDGTVNTGTLVTYGAVTISSAFNGGSSPLTFSGGNEQAFNLTGAEGTFNAAITVSKTAGTSVSLSSGLTMDNSAAFTVSTGTFNANGNAFSCNGDFTVSGGTFLGSTNTLTFSGTITLSSGTLTLSSGTTNIGCNLTHTAGGTFNHNSGTVVYNGNNKTWNFDSTIVDGNSGEFWNFTDNSTSVNPLTISAGDSLTVNNTLLLTDGAINTGTIAAKGDVTVAQTFNGGTATLTFSGSTATQNFDLTNGEGTFDSDITINKTSGSVNLLSTLTMDGASQDLIIQGGTFDISGQTLTVNGSSYTFIVQSGGNLQLQGNETVTNAPTFQAGSTVTYDGAAGPYTMKAWTYTSATVVINGNSVFTLAGARTFANCTITSGTLSLAGNNLTVSTAFSNEGTLRWRGSETLSLPAMDTNSGTIEFTGDGDVGADTYTVTTLSTTYYSLIINSTDGATDIFQLGAALDINNSLTITAGDFDVTTDNRAITVGGNFARVGTFTQRSGTVTFDDATKTSIISGSTTFNNFTCVTQDKNFQFTAASTQTISGTLTLTGAADHLIVLRSTSTDSYWNLIAGASQAVTYVDVKDSDASGGTIVNPGLNSTDSGHNLNWQFQPVVTWSAASQSGAESAGTMTVTANLSYAYASDVTIPYTITGTATATTDYTITASPLVITAGNTSGAITITVVDDTIDELDETVIVTMGDPTNGTKGTTSVHTATITDNDAAPTIAINDPTVSESAGTGTVTVTLTGGSYLGVTVDYATSSGTAISGTDFTATSGTLTWAANETGTKTFTVTITNDILDENDETLTLTLSNPSNSTIADSTGVLTIIDNDDAPTVATVTGTQGTDGTGDVTITFIMDDSADDDTLQAKIEYSLNGGIDWADPTISVTNGETLATYGDPSVDNTQTYQVGQTGAYITSSSGANTVSIVWEAATDVSVSTNISNAQIRVTPYDGTEIGTSSLSPDFIVDRTAPSGLASFAYMDFSSSHAVLTWTAATDTNFNHYEIWHGETESQVISRNGSAVEWDNSDDATLVTASTATSTINNTDPRNKYFKIFAVDNYGNELTVTDIYIGGGHSSYSSSGSSSSSGGGSSSSDDDSTTTTTATTVTDTTEDEEPSEEVVEEETDEPEDTSEMTWEDFDVNPPEEHWSEGYVKHLEEQTNIIEVAVSQPSFLDILLSILETPDNPMPRGNALEFLLVLAGYSLDTITINVRSLAFEDLSLDDDQAGFIQFAYEQGLIQGYPDGTFQTDRVVNRAEALKLCSYFFEGDWTHPVYGDDLLALYGLTENPFTDVDLSQWYAPYLINAYAKGVVSGYGDGTFGPANSVTYAEFLKIATLMQNIEDAVELAEELE